MKFFIILAYNSEILSKFATEIFKFQLVMKRKIYKQLLKWKESKDRKPLMLLGARQVGKTWIMQHFGKKEYKNVAYKMPALYIR